MVNRKVRGLKKKKRTDNRSNRKQPLLGIDSKFNFKLQQEIKPPFKKKTLKKLKKVRYNS